MANDNMGVSLFRVLPVRRGRLALMVVGSLVFHSGVVLVGAVWFNEPAPASPLSPRKGGITVFIDPPKLDDENVQTFEVSIAVPTPSRQDPVPVPPTVAPAVEALPPAIEPPMDVSETPSVRPRSVSAVRAAPPAGAVHTTATSAVGAPSGRSSIGTSGGSALGWNTPKPPYPRNLQLSRVQGTATVRITTDASGRVTDVVIVRSTGNSLLDAAARSYALSNWKGPVNSSRTMELVYQIP